MVFGEISLTQDNNFTSSDLLNFVQLLIKDCMDRSRRLTQDSNYGWLQSRPIELDVDLEKYKTTVLKLSPESRAAIAVKLANITEEVSVSTDDILSMFENIINEQENMKLIEKNLKIAKKMGKKKVLHEPQYVKEAFISFVTK